MKRLTENYKEYIQHFPEEFRDNGYSMDSDIVYERLGAYEDLQDKLDEYFDGHISMADIIETLIEYDSQLQRNEKLAKAMLITNDSVCKFREWEELEKQGKLVILPCAVGDTVYRVHRGTELSPDRVYECRVVGLKQEYNAFSVKLHANINEERYSIWIDDWFDKCQIGHEFFLTREEAESVVKEGEPHEQ